MVGARKRTLAAWRNSINISDPHALTYLLVVLRLYMSRIRFTSNENYCQRLLSDRMVTDASRGSRYYYVVLRQSCSRIGGSIHYAL